MAIVVLSETPNMTSEQYDTVATELGLSNSLPEGCLAHIAGLGPDGSTWRDISVWESGDQANALHGHGAAAGHGTSGCHPHLGAAGKLAGAQADPVAHAAERQRERE